MHPSETFKPAREYISDILDTWNRRNIKPKFHVSEQGSGKCGHHSDFIEVTNLLIYGDLPNKKQLNKYYKLISNHTMVHEQLLKFFNGFRRDAHPMAMMVGVMGALSSFYQDSLDITLNPIDPIQDGRASKFEILLNTMDYGKASIVFRLDSTYKNKKFVMYSDTVVIKTIDEPIKEPIVEIVKDINSIDAIQDKIENQSNIMITIFIILSVIIIILISMGVYALINYSVKVDTRGYIYDDKNNMIFDINSIHRHFINKILHRNKIVGSDFNDDLLKGLEFKFMEGFLILTNISDQSVRVNNQPLSQSVEIYSKAWIGIQGKIILYSEEIL